MSAHHTEPDHTNAPSIAVTIVNNQSGHVKVQTRK